MKDTSIIIQHHDIENKEKAHFYSLNRQEAVRLFSYPEHPMDGFLQEDREGSQSYPDVLL